MNKVYCCLLSLVSLLAGWASISAVNSACNLVLYEEELPEELR